MNNYKFILTLSILYIKLSSVTSSALSHQTISDPIDEYKWIFQRLYNDWVAADDGNHDAAISKTELSGQTNSKSKCSMTQNLPDPNSKCCGVDSPVTSYIVGGKETRLGQYPWLVLIEYRTAPDGGYFHQFCGGSLISGRYVITAAHCVVGPVLRGGVPEFVRIGEYNKTTYPDCFESDDGNIICAPKDIYIQIDKIIYHEEYNTNTGNNDIALIRLRKLATYTDFVRPICLPTSNIAISPPESLNLTAAGWGTMMQIKLENGFYRNFLSDVKRHVNLPFFKNCPKVWMNITEMQFCAGGQENLDACTGDSGGPLMHNNGGKYSLVGVISYGGNKPCGEPKIPSVYVNVYKYKKWISGAIATLEKRTRGIKNKEREKLRKSEDDLLKALYLVRSMRLYSWQNPSILDCHGDLRKWFTNMSDML